MRVNEALGLDRPDVDLKLGILHIRRTKFGKSRYVPAHPSTVEALKKYAGVRDRLFPAPLIPAFLIPVGGHIYNLVLCGLDGSEIGVNETAPVDS